MGGDAVRKRYVRIFKNQKPPEGKKKKKKPKPAEISFKIKGELDPGAIKKLAEKIIAKQKETVHPVYEIESKPGDSVSLDSSGNVKPASKVDPVIGTAIIGIAIGKSKDGKVLISIPSGIWEESYNGKDPMLAFEKTYYYDKANTDLKKAIRGNDGGQPLKKVMGVIRASTSLLLKANVWAAKNAPGATEKDMMRASSLHSLLLQGAWKHRTYARTVVSQLNKITNPAKCFTRAAALQVRHLKFAAQLFRHKGALLLKQQGIL